MTLNVGPNSVDAALVALLSADGPTDPLDPNALDGSWFMDLCPGGVNHLVAPAGVARPYCVFGLTQPTRDTYTMAGLAFSDLVYGFDVIQEGQSAEQAQSASRRLYALLNDSTALAPSGLAVMSCRRIGYQERIERLEGGEIYQHVQSLFGLTVRPA
jgi:hypothetical protein